MHEDLSADYSAWDLLNVIGGEKQKETKHFLNSGLKEDCILCNHLIGPDILHLRPLYGLS